MSRKSARGSGKGTRDTFIKDVRSMQAGDTKRVNALGVPAEMTMKDNGLLEIKVTAPVPVGRMAEVQLIQAGFDANQERRASQALEDAVALIAHQEEQLRVVTEAYDLTMEEWERADASQRATVAEWERLVKEEWAPLEREYGKVKLANSTLEGVIVQYLKDKKELKERNDKQAAEIGELRKALKVYQEAALAAQVERPKPGPRLPMQDAYAGEKAREEIRQDTPDDVEDWERELLDG